MINTQTDICINLSHAKLNMSKAKSLIKEIKNSNFKVIDETNLKIMKEITIINKEIFDYIVYLS